MHSLQPLALSRIKPSYSVPNSILWSILGFMLYLINQAKLYSNNIAIIADDKAYTYQQLLISSQNFASLLLNGAKDLNQKRVAFVLPPGMDYVIVQWAIWQAGGIAVPLNPKAPLDSHRYVLEDAAVDIIVTSPIYIADIEALASELKIRVVTAGMSAELTPDLPDIAADRAAMILYTSGTTAAPKGVVSTHENIEAQAKALTEAWEWSATDRIINVLPMHHIHGIINILTCALISGASCEFMASFDPKELLDKLCQPEVTLFMAVPTIYYKLVAYWESLDQPEQIKISAGLNTLRLMVSGSAALPVSTLEKWKNITGHTLLERYGMTEIGMAISNPYIGERRPGHIGLPLPGVELRLVDEEMHDVQIGEQGEILVKGPNVFKEYWNKPEITHAAFTSDGWFKTGDIAIFKEGYYKIIGRNLDIIKSGGYKLSALEIEEVLRSYPGISDCGVVGIPDEEWGELVAAALIIDGDSFTERELILWLSNKLPRYKIPTVFKKLRELPRNAMGKVVKNELKEIFIHSV